MDEYTIVGGDFGVCIHRNGHAFLRVDAWGLTVEEKKALAREVIEKLEAAATVEA